MLRHVFADGGYAGDKLKGRLAKFGQWTMEIVKRSDKGKGFTVLPRRWVVERTFAWLGRCGRLAKDWEKTIASAEAWITIAHIRILTRRLARYRYCRGLYESASSTSIRAARDRSRSRAPDAGGDIAVYGLIKSWRLRGNSEHRVAATKFGFAKPESARAKRGRTTRQVLPRPHIVQAVTNVGRG